MIEIRTKNYREEYEIQPGVHPVVRLIWNEITDRQLSMTHLEEVSGVARHSMSQWRKANANPYFASIEDVLNALGYELKVVKRD